APVLPLSRLRLIVRQQLLTQLRQRSLCRRSLLEGDEGGSSIPSCLYQPACQFTGKGGLALSSLSHDHYIITLEQHPFSIQQFATASDKVLEEFLREFAQAQCSRLLDLLLNDLGMDFLDQLRISLLLIQHRNKPI